MICYTQDGDPQSPSYSVADWAGDYTNDWRSQYRDISWSSVELLEVLVKAPCECTTGIIERGLRSRDSPRALSILETANRVQ